jgi:plastocyanin
MVLPSRLAFAAAALLIAAGLLVALGAAAPASGASAPAPATRSVSVIIETHDTATLADGTKVNFLHVAPSEINEIQGTNLTVTIQDPINESGPHNICFACPVGTGYGGSDVPGACSGETNPDCYNVGGQIDQVSPGQSKTFSFILSKAGDFDYFCTIPGHRTGGMAGVLHVESTGVTPPRTPGFEAAWALLGIGAAAASVAGLRRRAR